MDYQEAFNTEVALKKAFRTFDKNDDGKITADELKTILGTNKAFSDKDMSFWEDMIREADSDGNGEVSDFRENGI